MKANLRVNQTGLLYLFSNEMVYNYYFKIPTNHNLLLCLGEINTQYPIHYFLRFP